jgi:hypothetical protein
MTRVSGAAGVAAAALRASSALVALAGAPPSAAGADWRTPSVAAFVFRGVDTAEVFRSVVAFFTEVFFSAVGVVSFFVDIKFTPQ